MLKSQIKSWIGMQKLITVTIFLFSIVAAPICITTNNEQVFCFPHILANTVVSSLFDNSQSNRYELISHCGFDLHFPDDY